MSAKTAKTQVPALPKIVAKPVNGKYRLVARTLGLDESTGLFLYSLAVEHNAVPIVAVARVMSGEVGITEIPTPSMDSPDTGNPCPEGVYHLEITGKTMTITPRAEYDVHGRTGVIASPMPDNVDIKIHLLSEEDERYFRIMVIILDIKEFVCDNGSGFLAERGFQWL